MDTLLIVSVFVVSVIIGFILGIAVVVYTHEKGTLYIDMSNPNEYICRITMDIEYKELAIKKFVVLKIDPTASIDISQEKQIT